MELTLTAPLDMHLHLREGDMLDLVAPFSASQFAGAVIMPNLVEPVNSLERLLSYRQEVVRACGDHTFEPYMTLFFQQYTHEELKSCAPHIIGVKLYPAGITTQSEAGVHDFSAIGDTLASMQELGIPLLVHGETGGFVMDREDEFLPVFDQLARQYPKLHIVMEHITTKSAINLLDKHDNLSATVTLHHLLITLDDLAGNLLEPDLFCKPIAKTPGDRDALRKAVFEGHPKLMFGSDSAPHPRHKKECTGCAAGIFSAPVALPLLAETFDSVGCIDRLQDFVSTIAVRRYGLQPPAKKVTLQRSDWHVPEVYADTRPFYSGQRLRWKIKAIS